MAEKETKVTKVEVKPIPSDREGLLGSVVTQSADLAERATTTAFGIVRDVQGEINQRLLGAISLVEGTQQGAIKLVRSIDDRVDRLLGDTLDTAENLLLGVIRAVRDTGRNVTDLATNLTKPREVPRAA